MANGEIYEKNLSNASGIGSGDYLRTVNSNNESEKINYTLLAKAIIEQWTGSTLAGSSQSVKSAVDTLNKFTTWHKYTKTTRTELLAEIDEVLSSVGQGAVYGFMVSAQATLLGLPSASYYVTAYANSVNYREVKFLNVEGTREFTLSKRDGTWESTVLDSSQRVTTGTLLTSGTDLMTLGIGEYVVDSGSVASTLINSPTSNNFKLVIFNRTSSRKGMVLFDKDGTIWLRSQTGDNVWTEWKRLQLEYKSYSLTDHFTRNTSTTSDASGRIMSFGNCVTIVGQVGGVEVTSSSGVVIGNLTKYAPSANEIHCVGMIGAGSNGGTPVRLNVATNGNITAYGSTNATATIRFSASYITNNV